MWTFISFDNFACGFRFWLNFLGGFAVVDDFFQWLWGFLDPLILLYSGVLHRFLLYKFKKSLFLKLHIFPFVLFCVLNYSRLCIVISSEIVWEILLIFNFIFIFSGNKVLLSFSLHTWIWDWKWGECGLKAGVSVPDSLILPLSALSCINFLIFHSSMNF